jgi:hypothetical protein
MTGSAGNFGPDDARRAQDDAGTDDLLPAVYDQLRSLAQRRLADERPGHTLQATALVHEAYLRLAGDPHANWRDRAHFFAAAAEAMRRILVEQARRRAPMSVVELGSIFLADTGFSWQTFTLAYAGIARIDVVAQGADIVIDAIAFDFQTAIMIPLPQVAGMGAAGLVVIGVRHRRAS